jgi:predicted GH43/DUF377 family glycosyl hydrolase
MPKYAFMLMTLFANANALLVACFVTMSAVAVVGGASETQWELRDPILSPGPKGSFDEVAVKDPSLVYFEGKWHVFYTARSKTQYTTGYVSAKRLADLQSAPRYELDMIRGKSRYGPSQ